MNQNPKNQPRGSIFVTGRISYIPKNQYQAIRPDGRRVDDFQSMFRGDSIPVVPRFKSSAERASHGVEYSSLILARGRIPRSPRTNIKELGQSAAE
jgi:hypothetical protein